MLVSTLLCLAPLGSFASTAPRAASTTDERDPIVLAIEAGRLEEARVLLDARLGEDRLGRARALLAGGNARDGLAVLDDALELLPGDAQSLLLRAEGRLMLAEEVASSGGSALFVEGAFQDALEAFREVPVDSPGTGVRVLFGASRSAFSVGQAQEALDFARRGMQLAREHELAESLPIRPERTWAEASFLAYREARNDGTRAEDAQALFLETRDALERLVARTPEDPWVWTQLARLYQWEGRLEESTAQLQRGLDHAPRDSSLLQVLVEVATAKSGALGATAELDVFLARHPSVAMGYWYRARVGFDEALQRLLNGDGDGAAFSTAETDFVRCRDLNAEHDASCRAYEVVCRNARGWVHYNAGEWTAARDAFLSMESVFEGGLEWAIEGQLLSGIQGLEFVAQAFNDEEDWGSAAEVFELLRKARPDNPKWANNAGFFHRDAGVPLEQIGRMLCAAANGEPLPSDLAKELEQYHEGFANTPEGCRALSDRYMAQARKHMRASYAAYLEAARLGPDDVRVVNDTALIAVYYLHEDLEKAEALLRRSIEMGAQQLEERELTEEERYDLENAWGDAFQNLGVLYLWQRRDREEARALLERCLGLGDSRPFVRERLLPLCDASEAELAAAEDQGLRPWGLDCE